MILNGLTRGYTNIAQTRGRVISAVESSTSERVITEELIGRKGGAL